MNIKDLENFTYPLSVFVGLAMEEVLRIVCMRVCVRLIERGEDLNCD